MVLFAGLLAALPALFAERLPMVDLPQYAGQVAMLDAMLAGQWRFETLFDINWLIPYWGAYGPLWVLAQVLPLPLATKLVVMAALAGLPIATALLLRRFGGEPQWAWLVVPASFGFVFNWGFVNFLVAAPLGLLLILTAESHARQPRWGSALALALLTHLVFFSHILVLVLCGTVAGLVVLARAATPRRMVLGLAPLAAVVPVALAWALPSLGKAQVQFPVVWAIGWHRLEQLPSLLLGAGNSLNFLFVCAAVFGLPLLAGGRLSRRPERFLPFLLVVAILAFVPHLLAGTYFTYHRFAIFLVPLYLLMIEAPARPPPAARLAHAAMLVLAVGWVGLSCLRISGFDREGRDFERVLDSMAPDQRVLSLVFDRGSAFSIAPVFLHYPVWYQAEKGGLVDFNFAHFVGMPVQYKPQHSPAAGPGFVWRPEQFTWDGYGSGYDYVLLRTPGDQAQSPLNLADCRATVLAHSGSWWLYRVNPPGELGGPCPPGSGG